MESATEQTAVDKAEDYYNSRYYAPEGWNG